jgi:hypothetical protein
MNALGLPIMASRAHAAGAAGSGRMRFDRSSRSDMNSAWQSSDLFVVGACVEAPFFCDGAWPRADCAAQAAV